MVNKHLFTGEDLEGEWVDILVEAGASAAQREVIGRQIAQQANAHDARTIQGRLKILRNMGGITSLTYYGAKAAWNHMQKRGTQPREGNIRRGTSFANLPWHAEVTKIGSGL